MVLPVQLSRWYFYENEKGAWAPFSFSFISHWHPPEFYKRLPTGLIKIAETRLGCQCKQRCMH